MNNINAIKQVAALQEMPTADLKKKWADLHPKTEPPPYNRVFLLKRLAHRIQELAIGGLTGTDEKRLERLANEEDGLQETKRMPGEQLFPGTRLIRDWKGTEHCCTVLENGFEYQGRKFGSLSAVATAITGTKWNGLVFFGMKKQREKV
ncbi:MAG: DUF2924 domain-containing protein [Magnetococcales bacterium]|nr:DUF2924 domain-containing protein [Magnetococcales bacterium]